MEKYQDKKHPYLEFPIMIFKSDKNYWENLLLDAKNDFKAHYQCITIILNENIRKMFRDNNL